MPVIAIKSIRRAHPTYANLRLCVVLQGVKEVSLPVVEPPISTLLDCHWRSQDRDDFGTRACRDLMCLC